jgi:deazaflavin-dependent oxidoreductase (nitroreductase family)
VIAPSRRSGVPARSLDRVIGTLVGRLGVPVPALRILVTRDRGSGRPRERPVLVLRTPDARYLVAARGVTGWARDLRADGRLALRRGRRAEELRAVEVDGAERDAALAAYVRRFGWLTGRFFDLPRRPRPEDARRVAARHPTFRLMPRGGSEIARREQRCAIRRGGRPAPERFDEGAGGR